MKKIVLILGAVGAVFLTTIYAITQREGWRSPPAKGNEQRSGSPQNVLSSRIASVTNEDKGSKVRPSYLWKVTDKGSKVRPSYLWKVTPCERSLLNIWLASRIQFGLSQGTRTEGDDFATRNK